MRNIYFICPDINTPTGGVKKLYRQVDVLNNNGFKAYILHGTQGFKCTWFSNNTSIVYSSSIFRALESLKPKPYRSLRQRLKITLKRLVTTIKRPLIPSDDVKITKEDILVFPEIYGPRILEIEPGTKKVIYNQGVYQTFFHYDLDLNNTNTPYGHDHLLGVIVNSRDAVNYFDLAFPKQNVYLVRHGFDSDRFQNNTVKKKQICFMPRRLKSDVIQVVNILKFKGLLDGWSLKPIENMSETEVAQCMKESAIFLNFSTNEGFGMPPAEAMACGCIVVGYPGHGGDELFDTAFSFPVANRDVQGYVKTLESVLKAYENDENAFAEKTKSASEFILKTYSVFEEERTIINTWKSILKPKQNIE